MVVSIKLAVTGSCFFYEGGSSTDSFPTQYELAMGKYPHKKKYTPSLYVVVDRKVLEAIRDDALTLCIFPDFSKESELGYDEDGQWWWGDGNEEGDTVALYPEDYAEFLITAVNVVMGYQSFKRALVQEIKV